MQDGTMLGHYRLAAKLGAGGMGEVFRARDTKLDREVAVKILPEAVVADPDRHARFHREARAMAAFSHPHVAAVHALEEHAGRHFLVMELVEGESLAQLLARGPLPVPRALAVARQMAAGIEAAHAAGIVHRDLKPANVMLTTGGDVKILDFGLAKVFADDPEERPGQNDPTLTTDRTRAGMVLGTAAYMSPEQARGTAVDKRADVWAYGAVLFEMVSGRRPFTGATVTDTLAAVLRAQPAWEDLPGDLPAPVGRLIHRCLQKDPRRRLHDVADARIVLEDLDAPDGPYGPESSLRGLPEAGGGAPRPVARRRPWLPLALVAAACGLAAWALWLRPEPVAPPPRIRALSFSGRDWAPCVSPDGGLVAFVSDRDGVSRIWLKQLGGGGETPLTDGPDDMPRFSPDGAQVLYSHDGPGGRDLYRVAVVGGQPRRVVGDAVEGDWAPDGQRIAFLRARNEGSNAMVDLVTASLQSDQEHVLHTGRNVLMYGVRWSPDGGRIAVNSAPLTGNVAQAAYVLLVDTGDGTVRPFEVRGQQLPCAALAWSPDGESFAVGQPTDLLSHVLGYPGLILECRADGSDERPVAWLPLRLPRGGWGTSTLDVLDEHRLVADESAVMAGLREVELDADGRPAGVRVLTAGLSRDRQPVYSPDGGTVLFSSNRSGNIDLWTVDRTSGKLSQITDDDASDWDPAFSPDGTLVLWSSDRTGNMEVWLAALDGTGSRQVSRDGFDAENPTMSPDGQWIVYASGNTEKMGIWKVRADGTETQQLLPGAYLLPEISPDGRHVLCATTRGLASVVNVVRFADGELLPFEIVIPTRHRQEDLMFGRARWLPDGSGIAYVGQDDQGRSGVYVQEFRPEGRSGEPRPVAGFDRAYATESHGIGPGGRHVTVAATVEQRTIKLVEDLDLRAWR